MAKSPPFTGPALDSITEKTPVASWSVKGFKVYFPVHSIREGGANRIVERERPYRDGAKLDDTGSKARRWTVVIQFANDIEEPGLEGNGGLALFPDVWRALRESFRVHETGDLALPGHDLMRARASDWDSNQTTEDQDAPIISCTFVEDSEDKVGADSFKQPSATANAKRLAEATTFDQASLGNLSEVVGKLDDALSSMEALVNAPGDQQHEMEHAAKEIGQLAKRTTQLFSQPGVAGRGSLLEPRGSRVETKLVRAHDMAARSAAEARRGRPQIARYIVLRDTSIFDISAAVQQPADELMMINPQLEDGRYIPRGTEVRVFTGLGTAP